MNRWYISKYLVSSNSHVIDDPSSELKDDLGYKILVPHIFCAVSNASTLISGISRLDVILLVKIFMNGVVILFLDFLPARISNIWVYPELYKYFK